LLWSVVFTQRDQRLAHDKDEMMNNDSMLDASTVLDLDILDQYTQAIGGKALLGSVDVFAQQFPQYLTELEACQQADDSKGVAAQGHKMKGAAGAIGLARLGLWAQCIQHDDAEHWQQQYPKYIAKIAQSYVKDIAVLRDYLENV